MNNLGHLRGGHNPTKSWINSQSLTSKGIVFSYAMINWSSKFYNVGPVSTNGRVWTLSVHHLSDEKFDFQPKPSILLMNKQSQTRES